jgi:thioredoxin 1
MAIILSERDIIMAKPIVTVFQFYRPDCAPCRMLAKFLEGIENELPEGVVRVEVNADENPAACGRYSIRSVPAIVFEANGEAIRHLTGVVTRDKFRRTLAEVIAEVK